MEPHGQPEAPASLAQAVLTQVVFAEVPVIMGPVVRIRASFRRAGLATSTMFLKEVLTSCECPLGWDFPGGIVGVQPVAVERLRKMKDAESLIQSNGQIDIFPDGELFVIPTNSLEAGFPK